MPNRSQIEVNSCADLASTFWNQGRWKEAEDLEVQVIETRKRVLVAEHPSTLSEVMDSLQLVRRC
jgi:hypothetical protein